VLLVGPLLVFSALGITAAVTSTGIVRDLLAIEPFGRIAVEVGKLVPYALIIGLFTFIYVFIPNTRVRLEAAFGGALVGGLAWQTAGWAFATFVAGSARYTAIYSGFAILVFFLIWLYVSWLIVLVGASVSFYIQHGEYVMARGGEPTPSARMRERLALLVMQDIATRHVAGQPPLAAAALARQLLIPSYAVRQVLDVMVARGLLVVTRDTPTTWVPARDFATVIAWEVIEAIRSDGEDQSFDVGRLPLQGQAGSLVEAYEAAMGEPLRAVSLRDLGLPGSAPVTPAPPPGR